MRKAKRVRFEDAETDGVPVIVSTRGQEASLSARSDAPRTSEYAYFRKVRNGATRGHSRSLHKENSQLNGSKINYSLRDNVISSALKSSSKDFSFPFSGTREGPSDCHLSFSPHVNEDCESDQIRTKEQTHKTGKSPSLLGHNVTPIEQCSSPPPPYEVPMISVNQCTQNGIFAAKRERLHQWAVQTIFSDSQNHPRGSDLVTSLLNRLFPKDRENDDVSGDKEKINKSSDNPENGLHLSCKRDWGNDLPKFSSDRSSDIVPRKWNDIAYGITFPEYAVDNYDQDQSGDCDQLLMHQTHSDAQHDFAFCLPVERYRSLGCFRFEGLDDLNSMIEQSREAPQRLFLEWDFQNSMHGIDRTNINHYTFAPRLTASASASWSADQPQILDDVCSAGELFSPKLLNHHLDFDSLATHGSTDYPFLDCGDVMKYAMAELGPSSLSLPWTPKSLRLAEDRDAELVHCKNNSIFTHTNEKSKAADGELYDDLFRRCSPEDFYLEDSSISHLWKFPRNQRSFYPVSGLMEAPPVEQLLNPFSEGTFKNSFLLSNLQSSFDAHINCPLLVSHVNQYEADQELYFVDNNKLEYRYAL